MVTPSSSASPLSGIICGVVYFPEALAQVQRDRTTYIIETLDSVKTSYPDCGVVLLGDFLGSQGGLVVIYRASHHCEPGFNSGLGQHVG